MKINKDIRVERLRACKTVEEIMGCPDKNKIEQPQEFLDTINEKKNMEDIEKTDLENVSGGITPYLNAGGKNTDRCPYYDSANHLFYPTGESRPTDAWFYDTEEHYVCACGAGYWHAGFWSLDKKWDNPDIKGPQIGNPPDKACAFK